MGSSSLKKKERGGSVKSTASDCGSSYVVYSKNTVLRVIPLLMLYHGHLRSWTPQHRAQPYPRYFLRATKEPPSKTQETKEEQEEEKKNNKEKSIIIIDSHSMPVSALLHHTQASTYLSIYQRVKGVHNDSRTAQCVCLSAFVVPHPSRQRPRQRQSARS